MYHVLIMAKKKTIWTKRLLALRERLGITQEAAAARVRVSRRAWVKWETGVQIPSAPHQLLIDLLEQGKI